MSYIGLTQIQGGRWQRAKPLKKELLFAMVTWLPWGRWELTRPLHRRNQGAVAEVSEATCICLVCKYLAKRETRAREISAHRAAVYTHAHTHKVLVMCQVSQQSLTPYSVCSEPCWSGGQYHWFCDGGTRLSEGYIFIWSD